MLCFSVIYFFCRLIESVSSRVPSSRESKHFIWHPKAAKYTPSPREKITQASNWLDRVGAYGDSMLVLGLRSWNCFSWTLSISSSRVYTVGLHTFLDDACRQAFLLNRNNRFGSSFPVLSLQAPLGYPRRAYVYSEQVYLYPSRVRLRIGGFAIVPLQESIEREGRLCFLSEI